MGCKHKWRCRTLLTFRTGFDSLATHHFFGIWNYQAIVSAWKAAWWGNSLCFEYTVFRQFSSSCGIVVCPLVLGTKGASAILATETSLEAWEEGTQAVSKAVRGPKKPHRSIRYVSANMELWPSGWRHPFTKRTIPKGVREFESHRFRHTWIRQLKCSLALSWKQRVLLDGH